MLRIGLYRTNVNNVTRVQMSIYISQKNPLTYRNNINFVQYIYTLYIKGLKLTLKSIQIQFQLLNKSERGCINIYVRSTNQRDIDDHLFDVRFHTACYNTTKNEITSVIQTVSQLHISQARQICRLTRSRNYNSKYQIKPQLSVSVFYIKQMDVYMLFLEIPKYQIQFGQ